MLALILSPAKLPKSSSIAFHAHASASETTTRLWTACASIRLEIATLAVCRIISRSGAGNPAEKTECHRQIQCLRLQRNLHSGDSLSLQTKVVCRGSALSRSPWCCPKYQSTRDKEPRHSNTFQTQPLESYIRSFGALPINWTNHSRAALDVFGSLRAFTEWDSITTSIRQGFFGRF